MAKQKYIKPETLKATGWDTGLCQDYHKGLARWFSTRPEARYLVDKYTAEAVKEVKDETQTL